MKKNTPYILPSFADLIFVILLITLSSSLGQGLLSDGDTGFHIRAGEYILENWSIPRVDMFSFLVPAPEWTAHEWLSEVIMAFVHNAMGLTGIVIFYAFILGLTYYLFLKFLRQDHDHLLLTTAMVLLVISTSTIHFLARPHVFSLLFTVISYFIIDRYEYHNKNYLFFFPFVMLLWVNLHGGYIIGFLLLGTYLTGNIVYYFLDKNADKFRTGRKLKTYSIVIFACLAVSLVNPFGYHILLFPFDLVGNSFLTSHVNEFRPANFQDFFVFKYFFILALAVFMTNKWRLNVIELFLVLGFTYMSLYSVRYIPLFAIIVAPILLKRLEVLAQQAKNPIIHFLNVKSESFAENDKTARGFLWPALILGLIILVTAFGAINHSFDPESKPVQAVEFIKNEHIPGNMFNDDEFGDYVIYSAYPEYKVFFDGRSDMYGNEHLRNYIKIIRLGKGWENVFEEYNIQWVFFNAESLLSRYLLEKKDWHLIYADEVAHIYVLNEPMYKNIINKYKHVKPVTNNTVKK
ncbi:hypothetical protein [Desulfohalobium retbaense]|uniref:Glycosyltransferase RgtA/B/C/D-like domain-containing protein n=1 Tax=Desulfohalobium retbaense (strain ATCC 49708 / DSM 5692 / JCM 16813 / HR100) TaxID=485915 RepID=C8X1P4_DESRD|nr:hypothetical protein [Desulfohalobium retbaense]ACV68466.1 conserved hypothetical protein [Desulfohalobium retbaense DSM 5692]